MNLINVAIAVFSIEVVLILAFFEGEKFATKYPGYRFSKWWRRNIAMHDDGL